MKIGNLDLGKLRGLSDKAVGLQKEFWGVILDNDRLTDEGRAQQDAGSAKLDALKHEAQAEKARAEANVREKRQRTAERAKESASS